MTVISGRVCAGAQLQFRMKYVRPHVILQVREHLQSGGHIFEDEKEE